MEQKMCRFRPRSLALIAFCAWILLGMCSAEAAVGKFSSTLQGQSKGDTNWIVSNLQGWQDCDYIPITTIGRPVSGAVFSSPTSIRPFRRATPRPVGSRCTEYAM